MWDCSAFLCPASPTLDQPQAAPTATRFGVSAYPVPDSFWSRAFLWQVLLKPPLAKLAITRCDKLFVPVSANAASYRSRRERKNRQWPRWQRRLDDTERSAGSG